MKHNLSSTKLWPKGDEAEPCVRSSAPAQGWGGDLRPGGEGQGLVQPSWDQCCSRCPRLAPVSLEEEHAGEDTAPMRWSTLRSRMTSLETNQEDEGRRDYQKTKEEKVTGGGRRANTMSPICRPRAFPGFAVCIFSFGLCSEQQLRDCWRSTAVIRDVTPFIMHSPARQFITFHLWASKLPVH